MLEPQCAALLHSHSVKRSLQWSNAHMHRFQPRQHRLLRFHHPQASPTEKSSVCSASSTVNVKGDAARLIILFSMWPSAVGVSSKLVIRYFVTSVHRVGRRSIRSSRCPRLRIRPMSSYLLPSLPTLTSSRFPKLFDPPPYPRLSNLYFTIICISFIVLAVEVLSAYPWLSSGTQS